MQLNFTISKKSITLFLDGDIFTVSAENANYVPLAEELKKPKDQRDFDAIRELGSIRKMLQSLQIGKVTITDREVIYDGNVVNTYLSNRILELVADGFDVEIWARFMENAYSNPAAFARDELFEWLERAELPLTDDGCFIAFKKVNRDYTDCHTGKFDNSVGSYLEMDRDLCDPNRNQTCSTGFHFCSKDYLSNFGGERVMIVKVNPADVTSIPSDYNLSKGRCCRYEVIGELTNESEAYSKAWRTSAFPGEISAEVPGFESVVAPKKKKKKKASNQGGVSERIRTMVVNTPNLSQASKKKGKKAFAVLNGQPFNKTEVKKLLKEHPSLRAAARSVGAPESTLRGIKNKLLSGGNS